MKYLAAYALLSLSGKKDISAADLKAVLGSTNVNVTDADLNRLIETLKGKDVNKLIASGLTKIGATASGPAAQQKKKQQPKKQAPKKQAPKVVEEEEEEGGMGGLFD